MRTMLRSTILPALRVKRIHIIGCSRSGTTMLHFALGAFRRVILCPTESDVKYTPNTMTMLRLAFNPYSHYVTKRDYSWFRKPDSLVADIRDQRISIINLIRDPRDVLSSKQIGSEAEYYVSSEMWQQSVDAGHFVVRSVKDDVPTLELRYEDVIKTPDEVEKQLNKIFGLEKHISVNSITNLKDNLDLLGISIDPLMVDAMHSVRNLDERSIGKWRENMDYIQRLMKQNQGIQAFIERHDY